MHKIPGFIDIHSHLLPVQDGPKNMEQALQALRVAEESNITDMILTPHYFSWDRSYDQEYILDTFENLKKGISTANLKIRIYLGNECVVDEKLVEDIESGKAFTLNNTKYVLCEYPLYQVPCNYNSIIYKLLDKGYKPIIAHPERNAYIEKNYESIVELMDNGCLLQSNASSFLGKYGSTIKKYAFAMLNDNLTNIIATDSHSSKSRSPAVYDKIYKKLKNKLSALYFMDLFDKNPRFIL